MVIYGLILLWELKFFIFLCSHNLALFCFYLYAYFFHWNSDFLCVGWCGKSGSWSPTFQCCARGICFCTHCPCRVGLACALVWVCVQWFGRVVETCSSSLTCKFILCSCACSCFIVLRRHNTSVPQRTQAAVAGGMSLFPVCTCDGNIFVRVHKSYLVVTFLELLVTGYGYLKFWFWGHLGDSVG